MQRRANIVKWSLFSILFLMASISVKSQIHFGLKGGLNTNFSKITSISIGDPKMADYTIQLKNNLYGYQGGIFTRITAWKLFLQVDVLCNSNKRSYVFNDALKNEVTVDRSVLHLSAPVVLGYKIGWFELQGGFSGLYSIPKSTSIAKIPDLTIFNKELNIGYLAGVGLYFKPVHFDLRYEINSNALGDQFSYKGKTYVFHKAHNRLILNIGFHF